MEAFEYKTFSLHAEIVLPIVVVGALKKDKLLDLRWRLEKSSQFSAQRWRAEFDSNKVNSFQRGLVFDIDFAHALRNGSIF